MLKVGLIGLAIGTGCLLLLALLSQTSIVSWGPCGPDPFGWLLILGFLVCVGLGILLTIAGLIQKSFRKLLGDGNHLSADQAREELQ
jgi:hypothetical protein